MADNEYQAALTGTFTRSSLLASLILRAPYVLLTTDNIQALDMQTATVVISGGQVFLYDAADTTSAHDGTTVLVDENGRRYKLVGSVPYPDSVLDRLGTPPGSPTLGDTYLITTGTGDWAGQDDDLTVYTSTGWVFITAKVGRPLWVEDESAFYYYDDGGMWTQGLGSFSITAGTVSPIEEDHIGIPDVENTLNTPPGGPTEGQRWLVGTSPTGAWVGHNNKVATWRSSAWVMKSPHDGARIYDKTANDYLSYEGSAWTGTSVTLSTSEEFIAEYDFGVSGALDPVDFTGLGGFVSITALFQQMQNGANAIPLRTFVSDDDGSTFKTAASDYIDNSGSTSNTVTLWTGAGPHMLKVTWDAFNVSNARTHLTITGSAFTQNHIRNAEEVNNAIRFDFTSFNANTGRIVLLGRRG